jgi:hypothetical protein
VLRRRGVTYEIDAAMCFVEPVVSAPPVDLIAAYSGSEELCPRNDPMLAGRQLRDNSVSGSTE